ncbi:MAG: phage tail protein [bacterium]
MAQFTAESKRFDPYKNFKFRVKWDGKYVAGVHKVGALKRHTEAIDWREGADPSSARRTPGQTKYEAITLERGVTHDIDFEQWANKVWNYGGPMAGDTDGGKEVSLKDFRKDIIIDIFNESGQKVVSYVVYRCWVSEYQATADLDASGNAVLISTIKLENEGWERDYTVGQPDETSYAEPAN